MFGDPVQAEVALAWLANLGWMAALVGMMLRQLWVGLVDTPWPDWSRDLTARVVRRLRRDRRRSTGVSGQ